MLADLEGDAALIIQAAQIDPDGTVNVRRLVQHHLGAPPKLVRMRSEAELVTVEGVRGSMYGSGQHQRVRVG